MRHLRRTATALTATAALAALAGLAPSGGVPAAAAGPSYSPKGWLALETGTTDRVFWDADGASIGLQKTPNENLGGQLVELIAFDALHAGGGYTSCARDLCHTHAAFFALLAEVFSNGSSHGIEPHEHPAKSGPWRLRPGKSTQNVVEWKSRCRVPHAFRWGATILCSASFDPDRLDGNGVLRPR